MRTTINDQKLALKWACDERTIRRWRKARAPLSEPAKMRAWLATRKHLPPGTLALLESMRTSERAAGASDDQKQPEGAASALRRLEQAEARAYAAFKKATESGDDIAIKSSRENWLKISESLRRFDLALEQNRRDNGELILRTDVVKALSMFGWCIRVASESIAPQIALNICTEPSDQVRTRALIRRCNYDVAIVSYGAMNAMGVPEWIRKALSEDLTREVTVNWAELEAIGEFIKQNLPALAEKTIADVPTNRTKDLL